MSDFIKLSEVKEKKLRLEEMRKVKGGEFNPTTYPPPVLHYGVVILPFEPNPKYD